MELAFWFPIVCLLVIVAGIAWAVSDPTTDETGWILIHPQEGDEYTPSPEHGRTVYSVDEGGDIG